MRDGPGPEVSGPLALEAPSSPVQMCGGSARPEELIQIRQALSGHSDSLCDRLFPPKPSAPQGQAEPQLGRIDASQPVACRARMIAQGDIHPLFLASRKIEDEIGTVIPFPLDD